MPGTTPNLGLYKPDAHEDGCAPQLNANSDTIDAAITANGAAIALKPSTAYVDAGDAAEAARAIAAEGVNAAAIATKTTPAYADAAVLVEKTRAMAAEVLNQPLSAKDVAGGYPGLDADAQLKAIELPGWLVEGVNNSVMRGPVDGSNNPNYLAVSTVATVATAKFVCATTNLEAWIDGLYQKVADDNVVNVALANGSAANSPALNFVYLKKNTVVKQLTAADIGSTVQAPIFGFNGTQPAVSVTATKKFWFNSARNKWMSSVSGGAYIDDPIIPIAVIAVSNLGVSLGLAYWGPRMTPWKVMELFGQGVDGTVNQTAALGGLTLSGLKQYACFAATGGVVGTSAGSGGYFFYSQAPILVVNGSTLSTPLGGAASGVAGSGVGAGGLVGGYGGAGGGGGGSTAAGGIGGARLNSAVNVASGAGTGGVIGGVGVAGADSSLTTLGVAIPYLNSFNDNGGGGGAGSGDGTAASGGAGGGRGSGVIMLFSPAIVVDATSTISCAGTNGSPGGGTNGAGGGGSGGGVIVLRYGYLANAGTISVAGGAGGAGLGTGKNGGAGGAGFLQSTRVF